VCISSSSLKGDDDFFGAINQRVYRYSSSSQFSLTGKLSSSLSVVKNFDSSNSEAVGHLLFSVIHISMN